MGFGSGTPDTAGVVDLSTLTPRRDSDSEATPGKGASYLAGHPAVVLHGAGISSADLASFAEAFAAYSRSRVLGIGAAQYDDGKGQKFEQFSFNDVVLELIDEIADAHNYLTMLAVKALTVYGFMDVVDALKEAKEKGADDE